MDFDGQQRERHERRERELGDRSFTLRGETFTYIANGRFEVLRRVSALGKDTDGDEVINVLEDAVLEMIENTPGQNGDPDAHARFRAVCEQTEFPVTFSDLNEIAGWLIARQVGRPTPAPSASPDGRSPTGISSTDSSSSEPAAASAT